MGPQTLPSLGLTIPLTDVDSSAVIESKLEELNMLYKVLTVRYEEHSVRLEAEYSNHSNLQVHLSSVFITCFDYFQEVRY